MKPLQRFRLFVGALSGGSLSLAILIMQSIAFTADLIGIQSSGASFFVVTIFVIGGSCLAWIISNPQVTTTPLEENRSSLVRTRARIMEQREEKKQSEVYRMYTIALTILFVVLLMAFMKILPSIDQKQMIEEIVTAANEKQTFSSVPMYESKRPPVGSVVRVWEDFESSQESSVPWNFGTKMSSYILTGVESPERVRIFEGEIHFNNGAHIEVIKDQQQLGNLVLLATPSSEGLLLGTVWTDPVKGLTIQLKVKTLSPLKGAEWYEGFADGNWHTFEQVITHGVSTIYIDGIAKTSDLWSSVQGIGVVLPPTSLVIDDLAVWTEG